ncbi:LOW QUALITY PROTEIN: pescadillo homolog [Pyrus x bretschneideri]|uniref:LOW QUALITY PROTEIN: pescadillo homolog n=1 Tax=Pyrus x bretschneideri TaxID=225117 RepID=UPI00202F979B|nr:LOW QUALITY PROTEIN: pescadillo homolog [Pyrus x bretschneideri]
MVKHPAAPVKHKHYRPAVRKEKEGNAARYVTRSQAVKQLQVSLPVFRKLCILKGVFPREPKKKVKGNHHTYYHLKDVSFIQHEPLLERLREIRAYERKVKKADAKKNKERTALLKERRPTYKLDRIILQRYPKFVDALRDIDDCLTMVHLFAALPAIEDRIDVKRIHNCRRLSHEWQAYISRTHKLRKVFVSVKGIYYQAEVKGQKVTWLTPHPLQQVLTDDIDFNIMLNFLEFYEALLAFVNCHLYHSIDVKYPPILDSRLEALAAELYALARYLDANSRSAVLDPQASSLSSGNGENKKIETSVEESELRLAQLQHQLPSNEPGALMHLVKDVSSKDEEDNDTKECKQLFKDMKFFLNREVYRESLLFIIPAFGGTVSWEGEGAPFEEADDSITHQIVDRPMHGRQTLAREYVQPQWVYDCINARIILPTGGYLAGRDPPPHLSPFVDNEAEGYVPDYAETIKKWKSGGEVLPMPGVGQEDLEDSQNLLAEGVIDRAKAKEAAERKKKMMALEKQYHDELNMELQGIQHPSSTSNVDNQNSAKDTTEDAEEFDPDTDRDNMSKMLMSRKKRGVLEAMEKGKKRKKDHVEVIRERKRKLKESQK